MDYKYIKNSFPDYEWIETTVAMCETCCCYDKNKVSKVYFCSIWEKRPDECCSFLKRCEYFEA